MSITITITDPTPEQVAALFGGTQPAVAETKAATRKAKIESASTGDAAADPKPVEESSGVPELDAVKAAAQKLVNASSREALAELLETFAAKNLSSIPEGKRAAFIEQCENKAK